MISSSPHRPRSMVWIAGVRASHMLVSQIRPMSALQLGGVRLRGTAAGCRRRIPPRPRSAAVSGIGKRAGDRLPGAAGLDEDHDLALVVRGAARPDGLGAVGAGLDEGRERVVVPQLERIDRLDVVVAVEQRRRPPWPSGRAPRPWGDRASGGRWRRSRWSPDRPPASRPRPCTRRRRPGRSRST